MLTIPSGSNKIMFSSGVHKSSRSLVATSKF